MIDKLNQFQWRVAAGGYRFRVLKAVAAQASERLYLTASVPFGKQYPGFWYSPEAGLFLALAALEPHLDQIIEFANHYGMLTGGVWLRLDGSLVSGEPPELWHDAIRDLSLAVRMWELIKTGDTSELGQYIKWADSSGVRFERPADNASATGFQGTIPWLPGVVFDGTEELKDGRWIATRETNPALLETFQVGDLLGPAWYQLQHMVNEKLDSNVSARLLWDHKQLSMHQVPRDLISALWLQFARAIEGNREYQQCEECRNWFEVSSPDGGRKDKRFCNTACRARFWRKTTKREVGGKK